MKKFCKKNKSTVVYKENILKKLKASKITLLKRTMLTAVVVLILVFYGSLLFHKINLPTDDLGRHLENGKIIWQTRSVSETNFYSYTEPDFPFLNHHWLSGVIFYGLFNLIGFPGLVIFKILLLLSAFGLIFAVAVRRGNFWLAALFSISAIFVLSERTDLRPEIVSYFFTALFFYFLFSFFFRYKKRGQ